MPEFIVRQKGWKKNTDKQYDVSTGKEALDQVKAFEKDGKFGAAAAFCVYGGGDFTLLATKNAGPRTTLTSWAD